MYSARITRLNPTAFIILIDQSGSMEELITFDSMQMTKAEAVALVTNMLISELINRSQRDDGIRDYFDIAVLGYQETKAQSLLGKAGTFVKPSVLAQLDPPKKKFSRERVLPNGQNIISNMEHKFWIQPLSQGSTPMYDALSQAYELAGKWCRRDANLSSYPPTIFNISDGEASDGDPDQLIQISEKIKSLGTKDGNVLLLNINISTECGDAPVLFPSSSDEFRERRYARLLYDMSSEMPQKYNEIIAKIKGGAGKPPFRGMSYNTSITDLIAMMNIGSISVNIMQ